MNIDRARMTIDEAINIVFVQDKNTQARIGTFADLLYPHAIKQNSRGSIFNQCAAVTARQLRQNKRVREISHGVFILCPLQTRKYLESEKDWSETV